MSMRVWKLQEFQAHPSGVHCARLGEKSGQVLATGGDDKKVNIWKVGKPHAMMSLPGHASAVECLVFDKQEEVLVVGCAGGSIQVWNLEYRKTAGQLTGHRTACHSVEFHPYGEFFASGSADTNLKIWDLRRKSCIQTYKGHTGAITSIRFSPHGRWVATGGQDCQVKLWDLTAGKLMKDLDLHKGAITSLAFHPKEYLLATGSADKTTKLWSLESFKSLGSTDIGTSPVQAVKFYTEESSVLSASQDSLRICSQDQLAQTDILDVQWRGLQDMRNVASDERLLAVSAEGSQVAIWVADLQKRDPGVPKGAAGGAYSRLHGRGSVQHAKERVASAGARRSEPGLVPETFDAPEISPEIPDGLEARGQAVRAKDPVRTRSGSKESPSEDLPGGLARRGFSPKAYDSAQSPGVRGSRSSAAETSPHHRAALPEASPPSWGGGAGQRAGEASPAHNERHLAERAERAERAHAAAMASIAAAKDEPAIPDRRASNPDVAVASQGSPPRASPTACSDRRSPQSRAAPLLDDGLPAPRYGAEVPVPRPGALDLESLSQLGSEHQKMVGVLRRRREHASSVREAWLRGDLAGLRAQLPQDHAGLCDLLRSAIQGRLVEKMNLEICQVLMPAVQDLAGSKYDDFVGLAMQFSDLLLQHFGDLIADTRLGCARLPERQMDLAREERLKKCNVCYDHFREIHRLLLGSRVASRFATLRVSLQTFLQRC